MYACISVSVSSCLTVSVCLEEWGARSSPVWEDEGAGGNSVWMQEEQQYLAPKTVPSFTSQQSLLSVRHVLSTGAQK